MYITELIILDNDITSYNKEQATGDDRHNIMTLAKRELKIDLQDPWTGSNGPDLDCQVQQYLDGLGEWAWANDCLNFESDRYFGNKGLKIQKTRRVPLLPKVVPPSQDASLRRENVVIPLIEALEAKA